MPPRSIKVEEFLRNLPLFRDLSAGEVDRIAASTSQVRMPAGSILFRKGDSCAGFHVVVYGQVKLAFGASDGSEKVVEILGPGQSFGEAVMFLDKPYVVFAETLTDSLLLHVGKAVILQELERNPDFARRMLGGLAHRLHRMVSDLEGYSLKSGTQRVIGYLLRDVAAGPDQPHGGGDAAGHEERHRIAAFDHSRAFFAHSARTLGFRAHQGQRAHHPLSGSGAPAQLSRLACRGGRGWVRPQREWLLPRVTRRKSWS